VGQAEWIAGVVGFVLSLSVVWWVIGAFLGRGDEESRGETVEQDDAM
jgi:hypothetical protein